MVASPVRDRHTHSGVSNYQHATILLHRHTRDGTISDVKNTDLIEDQRTRVALYVRVSLDRREKASVEEQLADLRLTVDRLGWDIVAELADNDVPASRYSKADRPNWMRLLQIIRRGEVDAVGFWELSRSTRRRTEWAEFAELAIDCRLRILVGSSVYRAENPHEMHILDMMATQGVLEVDQLSERIHRSQRANAERGRPAGVPGYGYRRRYDPATGRLIGQEPDPDEAKVIRMIARWLRAGRSLSWIAEELNRRRIPTDKGRVAGEKYVDSRGRERVSLGWVPANLRRVMSRPELKGIRTYKGKEVAQGQWEPILSVEEWAEVQAALNRTKQRSAATGQRYVRDAAARWLLSGIAICDVCGGDIRAVPRSRRGRPAGDDPSRWRYRCNGVYKGAPMGHVTRRADWLDEAVEALLIRELSRPDVVEAFAVQEDPGVIERARAEILKIEEELRQLEEDVAVGLVTPRIASARERALQRRLEQLRKEATPRLVDPLVGQLVGASDVWAWWQGWELDQRRAALRAVTREIRVLPARVPGRNTRPPVEEMVRIVFGPVEG